MEVFNFSQFYSSGNFSQFYWVYSLVRMILWEDMNFSYCNLAAFTTVISLCSAFHFLEYGQDHFEGRSFPGVLVHAYLDEFGDVRGYARRDGDAESLEGYLHPALHWWQICKRHLPKQNYYFLSENFFQVCWEFLRWENTIELVTALPHDSVATY